MFFTTHFINQGNSSMGFGRDYTFHLANARGEPSHYPFIESALDSYPPLFKWISTPFSFKENIFYVFTLLFFVFLIPFVLFVFVKDFWIIFSYFFVSNFVWVTDIIGAYPQALATLFLFVFIYCKNPFIRLLIVFVSLLVHRWAWVMLFGWWAIEVVFSDGGVKKCCLVFFKNLRD